MDWSITARRAFAAATALGLVLACTACNRDFAGQVVGVVDGDTFDVMHDGQRVRVRLWQVDAPEFAQPFGSRARQALSKLVYQRHVQVRFVERDAQERLVAQVAVDGQDVNRELVALGMAWIDPGTPMEAPVAAAQQAARDARRGLWEDLHPIPPWEWRDRQAGAMRTTGAP